MKQAFYSFIILMAILLGGCRSFSLLTIDLSYPPREGLNDSIQSLLLLNRAADRRFTDDHADTIQLRFFEKQFNLDTVIYDLHASDTLLRVLGDLLFESGRYDVVIPVERFPKRDTINVYSDPMTWEEAERLTSLFKTDAVLSLDYHKTDVMARYQRQSYMDPETGEVADVYGADMLVAYIAQFRIFYPAYREEIPSFFLLDTLMWSDLDYDLKELFRRFTYVKPALAESGIAAALSLSEKIAPRWVATPRAVFLSGHPLLRNTAPLVRDHRWNEASGIWEDALPRARSKSLQSKLLFNLALAREMEGNLQEAIRTGIRSYETQYRKVTEAYLRTLDERRKLLNLK